MPCFSGGTSRLKPGVQPILVTPYFLLLARRVQASLTPPMAEKEELVERHPHNSPGLLRKLQRLDDGYQCKGPLLTRGPLWFLRRSYLSIGGDATALRLPLLLMGITSFSLMVALLSHKYL